ncbi:hypothetical protein EKN93_00985 [Enterobacter asburiae]|nr:hypothetical protein EKN93_00985 [Enterobacter asburiae]RUO00234.1 hypothetical protein EKN24_02315 [Enterobacter asburiae]
MASNAARTNFFIVMLPSVLFMRRVCGMDVQCHLMNLYAIKMIKYCLCGKKKADNPSGYPLHAYSFMHSRS